MTYAIAILGFVVAQRLIELLIAQRHTRKLLAEGGYEVGASHYKWIVAVHFAWLASLASWVSIFSPPVVLFWFAVYVVLQALRLWVMLSLGRYWTTRIIVVPQAPLIRRGPYRFMAHPNYAVVVAEIAVLPLVFGAWPIAIAFTILNALVLRVRIKAEAATFAARPAA